MTDAKERLGWRVLDPSWLRRPPDWLAATVYVVATLILLSLVFFAVKIVWQLFLTDFGAKADDANKLFLALAGVIGAPFVVWRVLIAARTNHIAQENLYTTLLTKAVEQLGATREVKEARETIGEDGKPKFETVVKTVPNTEVRLGAIYALEKLARDYEPLHWPIMEILCAYVRKNAGPPKPPPPEIVAIYLKGPWSRDTEEDALFTSYHAALTPPFVDVQAALTVIGRRPAARRKAENEWRERAEDGQDYRLDSTDTHLAKANLAGLDLSSARLSGSTLERANLKTTHLKGADLSEAHLKGADLSEAHLDGANLRKAHLEGADLLSAHLVGAIIWGAHLEGADLSGAHLEGASLSWAHLEDMLIFNADLSKVRGLDAERLSQAWGNDTVHLPDGLSRPKNERWLENGKTGDERREWIGRWRARRDFWRDKARRGE